MNPTSKTRASLARVPARLLSASARAGPASVLRAQKNTRWGVGGWGLKTAGPARHAPLTTRPSANAKPQSTLPHWSKADTARVASGARESAGSSLAHTHPSARQPCSSAGERGPDRLGCHPRGRPRACARPGARAHRAARRTSHRHGALNTQRASLIVPTATPHQMKEGHRCESRRRRALGRVHARWRSPGLPG